MIIYSDYTNEKSTYRYESDKVNNDTVGWKPILRKDRFDIIVPTKQHVYNINSLPEDPSKFTINEDWHTDFE